MAVGAFGGGVNIVLVGGCRGGVNLVLVGGCRGGANLVLVGVGGGVDYVGWWVGCGIGLARRLRRRGLLG